MAMWSEHNVSGPSLIKSAIAIAHYWQWTQIVTLRIAVAECHAVQLVEAYALAIAATRSYKLPNTTIP